MLETVLLLLLGLRLFLTPVVIGRAIMLVAETTQRVVLRKRREPYHVSVASLLSLPSYFAVGTLSLFGVALMGQYFLPSLSSSLTFQQFFFPAVLAVTGVSLVINLVSFPPLHLLLRQSVWQVALLILGLSAVTLTIWNWRTPWPLNWDLYEHQTLVNLMLAGKFSYFTSQISDTFGFNSYPPVFHTLMAVSQHGFGLQPQQLLQYWNVTSALHLVLTSIASYAFGFVVTRKRGAALLSCIFGTLVFESVIAFTNLFFLPQTLTAVLFILLMSQLFGRVSTRQFPSFLLVAANTLTLILFHYVIGSFAAVIYVSSFLYLRFQKSIDQLLQKVPVIELMIVLSIVGVIASQVINLGFLNKGEGASYVFSLGEKLIFAQRIYGYSLFFLLPLGFLAVIKKPHRITNFVALVTFGFFAVLISQFPYVLKFYVLARFFIHVLMAAGVWLLIEKISSSTLRKVAVLPFIVVLSVVLIFNSLYWKQGLSNQGMYTHISSDEVTAAAVIKEKYGTQNVLLISDPGTQYLLEATSGVNSAGGAFASRENREMVAEGLKELILNSNVSAAVVIFRQVRDAVTAPPQKYIVVLGGRTFAWHMATPEEKNSFDYNIWRPRELTIARQTIISRLEKAGLQPVYRNASLEVYEIEN